MTATLALAKELIACASLTPDDAHCQEIIARRLTALGFSCETISGGPAASRVTNLWAKRPANAGAPAGSQQLVFAGHTDVVPTGALSDWHSDPFTATLRDGRLYGRGAADMKSSIAAFVVAAEEFVGAQEPSALALAVLLTSDEEGPALDGTRKVCELLHQRGEKLDFCIVGEPTALTHSGDTIKNGRRGSLNGSLTVKGIQGHIAYPQLAQNPIHLAAPVLAELVATEWDSGNEFFEPTRWQVSNVHAGTGAGNVIPAELVIDFNFRFGTASTAAALQSRLEQVLQRHGLNYQLSWSLSGLPFCTAPGRLLQATTQAVKAETGLDSELSTSGGTSDARFIARICRQVLELGPPNASIHKIDEHVAVAELETLKNIYRRVLENLNAARPA